MIVNADAIQVFSDWRILTARPSPEEEAQAPHRLYGHVSYDTDYSVGHWLREVEPLLQGPDRPIIVGGTGLYFSALTEGLADIPPVPAAIREEAEKDWQNGREGLLAESRRADAIASRHAATPPVSSAPGRCSPPPAGALRPGRTARHHRFCRRKPARHRHRAPKDWLNSPDRGRFEQMFDGGRPRRGAREPAALEPRQTLGIKAIGAKALIAHLRGTSR